MMMMMILKAFVVFIIYRERGAFLSFQTFQSFHEAITAENFLKRRKVINLFIRVYPTLLPRTVIIQTHRRTIKTVSLFAV